VVDIDATAGEAPALAETVRQWLVERGIILPGPPLVGVEYGPLYGYGAAAPQWGHDHAVGCDIAYSGLQIVTSRTVFHGGENDIGPFICPHCNLRHDDMPWAAATGAWYDGEGDDSLTCPACGTAESIARWRCGWAFGYLGFGFWEGWMLDKLVDELAALTGHQMRRVHQHR
jgi:hypothetical protein